MTFVRQLNSGETTRESSSTMLVEVIRSSLPNLFCDELSMVIDTVWIRRVERSS